MQCFLSTAASILVIRWCWGHDDIFPVSSVWSKGHMHVWLSRRCTRMCWWTPSSCTTPILVSYRNSTVGHTSLYHFVHSIEVKSCLRRMGWDHQHVIDLLSEGRRGIWLVKKLAWYLTSYFSFVWHKYEEKLENLVFGSAFVSILCMCWGFLINTFWHNFLVLAFQEVQTKRG